MMLKSIQKPKNLPFVNVPLQTFKRVINTDKGPSENVLQDKCIA